MNYDERMMSVIKLISKPTSKIWWNLCDYSDAQIHVQATMTVPNA